MSALYSGVRVRKQMRCRNDCSQGNLDIWRERSNGAGRNIDFLATEQSARTFTGSHDGASCDVSAVDASHPITKGSIAVLQSGL